MTHAMVGLQQLHLDDAFRHPNVSTSMELLFCTWCLKLGRNTKTIAIHLLEVLYRMAIMCDICQAFAGISVQSILDHCSGCKAKWNKEHVGHEGSMKAPKKKKSWGQKKSSQSHSPDTAKRSGMSLYIFHVCKLVNVSLFTPWIILDHPRFILSKPLLSHMNCQSSCLLYSGAHIKQSLTILYNVFHVILNLHFD